MGYNEKVDIWSLGTLCYKMVVGCSPFLGSSMEELYQKVQNGTYILPSTLSEEIVSFINAMLQQDEGKRAEAKTLKNHPFLINYLSGGLIRMKSKQEETDKNNFTESNNKYNIWTVFNQQRTNKEALSTNQQTPDLFQFKKNNTQVQLLPPGIQSYFVAKQPFQY